MAGKHKVHVVWSANEKALLATAVADLMMQGKWVGGLKDMWRRAQVNAMLPKDRRRVVKSSGGSAKEIQEEAQRICRRRTRKKSQELGVPCVGAVQKRLIPDDDTAALWEAVTEIQKTVKNIAESVKETRDPGFKQPASPVLDLLRKWELTVEEYCELTDAPEEQVRSLIAEGMDISVRKLISFAQLFDLDTHGVFVRY